MDDFRGSWLRNGKKDLARAAAATLNVPPLPVWVGPVMNSAFVTLYPIDYASNPVEVILVP